MKAGALLVTSPGLVWVLSKVLGRKEDSLGGLCPEESVINNWFPSLFFPSAAPWLPCLEDTCTDPGYSKIGGQGKRRKPSRSGFNGLELKVCVALCVSTSMLVCRRPSTVGRWKGCCSLQTNGCALKGKLLSPLGNIQFQQLAPRVKEPPSPVCFCCLPKQCFDVHGAPLMEEKSSINSIEG